VSTKSSLYFDENFHLYAEALDLEYIYLALRSAQGPVDDLVIKIPLPVWKQMRQHTLQPEETYLDLTDDELLAEAERKVDEHREWLAAHSNSAFARAAGILTYGPPELSREEMVERFIDSYRTSLASARRSSR
jgi:hypothetical protein